MTEESEELSEFGEGFVYSMILFAKHHGNIVQALEAWKGVGAKNQAYDIWFNGAGDHVMRMEVPEELKATKVGRLAQEFIELVQPLRLPMDSAKSGTEQDFFRAFELLEELAMEIDRHLGAKPIKASWN